MEGLYYHSADTHLISIVSIGSIEVRAKLELYPRIAVCLTAERSSPAIKPSVHRLIEVVELVSGGNAIIGLVLLFVEITV